MGTCEACKFWMTDDHYLKDGHAGVRFGRCSRIRHDKSIESDAVEALADRSDWDAREVAEDKALAEALAYCVDGSGYHPEVRTGSSFGCVLHETSQP